MAKKNEGSKNEAKKGEEKKDERKRFDRKRGPMLTTWLHARLIEAIIWRLVKYHRTQKGLPQTALATILGVSTTVAQVSLSRWEAGTKAGSFHAMLAAATVIGVPFETLYVVAEQIRVAMGSQPYHNLTTTEVALLVDDHIRLHYSMEPDRLRSLQNVLEGTDIGLAPPGVS